MPERAVHLLPAHTCGGHKEPAGRLPLLSHTQGAYVHARTGGALVVFATIAGSFLFALPCFPLLCLCLLLRSCFLTSSSDALYGLPLGRGYELNLATPNLQGLSACGRTCMKYKICKQAPTVYRPLAGHVCNI